MEIAFSDVLFSVFSLVLLIIPGYLLVKAKVIGQSAGEACSAIVLYGCQPAMLFMSFQKVAYDSRILWNMLIVAGLTALVHGAMIGGVLLFTRKMPKSTKLNVIKYACVFSNCGYMGIPFLQSLFSGAYLGEVLIYAAVVIAVFNILSWTIGVYFVSGDKKALSVKKMFLNPTIIAAVVGFLFFILLKKPFVELAPSGTALDMLLEKAVQSLNFIGDTVTPLSMTVIGIRLANVKLTRLFTEKSAYAVAGIKLIAMSVITIACVAFLPVSTVVKYVMFFLLSMPCATSTALFAIRFNADEDAGSIYVLFTTIASIVTIPLTYLLFGLFL